MSALTSLAVFQLLLALAIGTIGGTLFWWLGLPLAFMIGSMAANAAAAIWRAPVAVPRFLRSTMIIIIGVLLGSAFSPELMAQVTSWIPTLILLAVFLGLGLSINYLLIRRMMRVDPVTAYCMAVPGGLTEMTILGASWGGDERLISLTHVQRIMIVVMTMPIIVQFIGPGAGDFSSGLPAPPEPGLPELGLIDGVLLAGCAVGGPLFALLRLPAAFLLGPMTLSAALHLSGITDGAPPGWLVASAQIVLGASIGCRFAGTGRHLLLRAAAASLTSTLILLALACGLVFGYGAIFDDEPLKMILAFSPGGLTEMSLIALALDVDAAYVATHQLYRISLVVILAPLVFPLLKLGPVAPGPSKRKS